MRFFAAPISPIGNAHSNEISAHTMMFSHGMDGAMIILVTRTPSLRAIHYFSVAARKLSFSAAADELHVTQGAVSRMIQSLERDLGVTLFVRGRNVSLTPEGERYAERIKVALKLINDANQSVREDIYATKLSMAVTTAFAMRWLVSRLPEFQERYPEVALEVIGDDPDDLALMRRAQVLIRFGAPPWPGEISTPIPLGRMGVVCSPEVHAKCTVNSAADLLDQKLLAHTYHGLDLWPEFFENLGVKYSPSQLLPSFNRLLMLAEAAITGQGYALVPLHLFRNELRTGRLVQAIPEAFNLSRGFYFCHERGSEQDPRISSFKRWLIAAARREDSQAEF